MVGRRELMPSRQQKIWIRMLMWLTAEILLNWVGFDHLADYSEFVFEKHSVVLVRLTTLID
jgi:hypothetical protein